jgi:hypothetical protein
MSHPRIHITVPRTILPDNPPDFYYNSTFHIKDPDTGKQWLQRIAPFNVRNLRKLSVSVHAVYNPGPYAEILTNKPPNGPLWRELMGEVYAKGVGLQEMVLYLDSEPDFNHWGPAVDVKFVRELGKFSHLQKMDIMGYFPKEWPRYL